MRRLRLRRRPDYGWLDVAFGTSAAAPHVAGIAALLVGSNRGAMRPAEVEAALRGSADDLGAPGFDPSTGTGASTRPALCPSD